MSDRPTPTPRTDAIAHAGHNESVYIARMTYLARELERELAAERALADRLAETLRFIEEDCDWKAGGDHWHGSFGDDRIGPACEEAVAAWKEARRE